MRHVSKTVDSASRIVWFEQTKRPLARNPLNIESEHLVSAHQRRHIDQQLYPMEQQAQKSRGFLFWATRLQKNNDFSVHESKQKDSTHTGSST